MHTSTTALPAKTHRAEAESRSASVDSDRGLTLLATPCLQTTLLRLGHCDNPETSTTQISSQGRQRDPIRQPRLCCRFCTPYTCQPASWTSAAVVAHGSHGPVRSG